MTTTSPPAPVTVDAAWPAAQPTGPDGAPAVRVLDVRAPAQFETARIRGSVNVPLDLLAQHRDELAASLDHRVVLVCRCGQRADQARNTLARTGRSNVRVLADGIDGWERHGALLSRLPYDRSGGVDPRAVVDELLARP